MSTPNVRISSVTIRVLPMILPTSAAILIFVAVALSGTSVYISAKALLAQQLLQRAWNTSLDSGFGAKPWRWADVSTSARLSLPGTNESFIVLSDASGEAMAFGPGLVAGNPNNAAVESLAIGGHRDTHLAFLEHIETGATIEVQSLDGVIHQYQLIDKQVVDSSKTTLAIANNWPGLVLVTCYPFNARQTGGPLRMVARAVAVEQTDT